MKERFQKSIVGNREQKYEHNTREAAQAVLTLAK